MTKVILRVRYSSRSASGTPGQALDLEDDTAQHLITTGRATLATALPADEDDGKERPAAPAKGKAAGGVRAVRSPRGSKAAEDQHTLSFYDPDRTAYSFDPAYGRRRV